jgi:hypothetical protein
VTVADPLSSEVAVIVTVPLLVEEVVTNRVVDGRASRIVRRPLNDTPREHVAAAS